MWFVKDMSAAPQTVYFDESGFTGRNLRDDDQPVFVYAGLVIEPDEAAKYLDRWARRHNVPRGANGEVKGSSLMTSPNPARLAAAVELVRDLGPNAWLAVFAKRFALAAKFFEYAFDPILEPKIGLFSALRFPQFLANLVALFARYEDDLESLLGEFAELVNRGDEQFASGLRPDTGIKNPMDCIRVILARHRKVIIDHVADAQQLKFGRWILDLTSTALFTLLMQIGSPVRLRVVVDESKPLAADTSVFDALVGQPLDGPQYIHNGMRVGRVSLAEPLILSKSHIEPGLQLADVIAASAAAIAKHGAQNRMELAQALDTAHQFWTAADPMSIDLQRRDAHLNYVILMQLAERSLRNEDLLEGIEAFIAAAASLLNDEGVPKPGGLT